MKALTPTALLGGTIGGGEMLLVMTAALLLFGSRNLPRIARSLGKAIEEFRRAAREVSDEILNAGDAGAPPQDRLPRPSQPVIGKKDADSQPPAG